MKFIVQSNVDLFFNSPLCVQTRTVSLLQNSLRRVKCCLNLESDSIVDVPLGNLTPGENGTTKNVSLIYSTEHPYLEQVVNLFKTLLEDCGCTVYCNQVLCLNGSMEGANGWHKQSLMNRQNRVIMVCSCDVQRKAAMVFSQDGNQHEAGISSRTDSITSACQLIKEEIDAGDNIEQRLSLISFWCTHSEPLPFKGKNNRTYIMSEDFGGLLQDIGVRNVKWDKGKILESFRKLGRAIAQRKQRRRDLAQNCSASMYSVPSTFDPAAPRAAAQADRGSIATTRSVELVIQRVHNPGRNSANRTPHGDGDEASNQLLSGGQDSSSIGFSCSGMPSVVAPQAVHSNQTDSELRTSDI